MDLTFHSNKVKKATPTKTKFNKIILRKDYQLELIYFNYQFFHRRPIQ